MQIDNVELVKITEVNTETSESGSKIGYTAVFEDKDNGIKVSVSQEEKFDLALGQKYSVKITTPQKTLS